MESWQHCYRAKKYFRNVGIAATALVAMFGIVAVFAAYFNIDNSFPYPKRTAVAFAVLWSGMASVGILLITWHYRYRLFISDSGLRQSGVLRDQKVEWHFVNEMRWVTFTGCIKLRSASGVIKLERQTFTEPDREKIIALLREAVPAEKQHGWDEYEARFADTPEKRELGRRAMRRLAVTFSVLSFVSAALAILWNDTSQLAIGVMNALVAGYLFRTNRAAKQQAVHQAESG